MDFDVLTCRSKVADSLDGRDSTEVFSPGEGVGILPEFGKVWLGANPIFSLKIRNTQFLLLPDLGKLALISDYP